MTLVDRHLSPGCRTMLSVTAWYCTTHCYSTVRRLMYDAMQVVRSLRELERLVTVMKRAIHDKELGLKKNTAQIDERTRHVGLDVCSDAMLIG